LSDAGVTNRTILFEGQVVGNVASFVFEGEPHVSYWIGKPFWGKGLASSALSLLLAEVVAVRPIYGRAVKDNFGSIRVMEKCGFVQVGEDKGFANGRGAEVEEVIMRLG
jgi:RimJ/RimL family protein N-acetyltransferase